MHRKAVTTQILLAIIAAALLLGGGLLRDLGERLPGEMEDGTEIIEKIKDFVGEIISPQVTVTRNVEINGSVTHDDLFEFEKIAPEKMEIEYLPAETNITADDKSITVQRETSNLTLENFVGYASFGRGPIEMEGEVRSLLSEGTKMDGTAISTAIQGKQNYVNVVDVEIKELIVEGITGSMDVGDSATLSLDEKPVKVHAFYGNLMFEDDELRVVGKANRVSAGNTTISA